MLRELLACSSVLSICFDFLIAVQHLPSPFSVASSGFLTAEALLRLHVGTNYAIKLKQRAGHCVILILFSISRTLQAESFEVSVLCWSA